jgi:hypothetical protein
MTNSKYLKRFLVVWITFHLLALSSNYLNLYLKTTKHRMEHCSFSTFSKSDNNWIEHETDYCAHPLQIYLFASPNCDGKTYQEFWPFVSYFIDGKTNRDPCKVNEPKLLNNLNVLGSEYFLGIFFHYDITEFIFYCSAPFLLIIIRKLWS